VLCIACFSTVKFVGTEFFPASDDSRLTVKLYMPVGTRTERTHAITEELAAKWMQDFKDEARVVNYTVGQASEDNTFASMQDNGSHIGSFNITLVEPSDRERTLFEISELIRADLNRYPEIERFTVSAGGNSGMGGQSSVDFEIYGYDFDATDRVAKELRAELMKIKGVSEVRISRSDYQPEIQVDFDREKLARHGLNLSTAATYLRNRINGSTASYYREDGDEHYIKVRYAPEYRTSIEDIENILIYTSTGGAVRIKDVGTVVERFSPPSIERKDRERVNIVKAIVSAEVPMGTIVAEGNKIIKDMDIPLGININLAGDFEEQQESFADLGMLGVLIILLVFIVLASQFESFTDPFIIITAVPLSIAGVILALAITGTSLNVMSLMGCIMLFGIVVKNGIVLIDYTKLCRERGMSAIQASITAAKSRLRPVLMTTLTTVLGMVPMALDKGEGSEMWRPLGVSVIGGLTVSTILTLVLVPVLYCMFTGVGIKRARRKHSKQLVLDAYWAENKDSMIKSKKRRKEKY
jgi:HAE1 family hydrophobic/amphiphilic exporter-1